MHKGQLYTEWPGTSGMWDRISNSASKQIAIPIEIRADNDIKNKIDPGR